MSTELAEPDRTLTPETLERLVVGGDLSKLSPAQRLDYYRARCEAAGVDVRTQPFQYLQLSGKLTLYATKTCTDQLISNRRLTVEVLDRRVDADTGICEVRCRVSFPDGRHVEDVGAVSVGNAKGDPLCNLIMKCVTKAKRRTVLSACGLGMLDESELETIPDHQMQRSPVPGEIQSVSGKETDQYQAWASDFVSRVNARWIDKWTDPKSGEIPADVQDLLSTWQLTGHLVKEGIKAKLVPDVPKRISATNIKLATKLWQENLGWVKQEASAYVGRLADEFVKHHEASGGNGIQAGAVIEADKNEGWVSDWEPGAEG